MRNFPESDLKKLMQVKDDYCISIYLPTYRTAAENEKNQIRFKNLLKRAEKLAQEETDGKKDVLRMLAQGQKLLDDGMFWRYQSDGLAVFLSPGYFSTHRLPIKFDELVISGKRFHVKPLLRMFIGEGRRYYILGLSQNQVRLILCTLESTEIMELEGISGGLKETMGYEDIGKEFQIHSGTTAGGGRRSAVFHGGGIEETDLKKNEILQFFREVDKEVQKAMAGDNAPIILAGVEFLLPLYKDASSNNNLLSQYITGNPDELSPEKLRKKAWPIVEPYFKQNLDDVLNRYNRLAGTGQASEDLETIVKSASQGRIETICFSIGVRQWGVFSENENAVTFHEEKRPESEDLLDLAVVMTLSNGGKAFALEPEKMPRGAPLAAIFRF